jgi:hypothetical protein
VSTVGDHGVFVYKGRGYIVESHFPGDRASGGSKIVDIQTQAEDTWIWDLKDPEVEYLGQGAIETKTVITTPDVSGYICPVAKDGVHAPGSRISRDCDGMVRVECCHCQRPGRAMIIPSTWDWTDEVIT